MNWRSGIAAVLLAAGVWQLSGAGWLLAKAHLAQHLIASAWQKRITTGAEQKPWSWADTRPVARLRLPGEKPLIVLAGSSGQALAFGPGLVEGSWLPGDDGVPRTTVIAAHRDTHFGTLGNLESGAVVALQDISGRWHSYRVVGARIVDSEREQLPILAESGLLLVTCYPFDAVDAGGPLRYVVYAESLPGDLAISL
ncbi:Sortase family protein [Microbulbifer aggregans]|uniref:Sortase family protein n=1 Tax=Microbulbifer aggregans TaxID=1769779 RepID=A0A1C9W3D6_9GAMM|nr:class GN sortase [Microbulbifer aggregans]AOS95644.1 Sortase family protein [Microbulbifer aggregans]